MKITMIIGEPCVGKSLLVKELMRLGEPWEFTKPKYVPHHHSRSMGLTILGRYDELHQFPGTDRMSMAAQPHVIQWLNHAKNLGTKSVLFEGDRLGNYKMAKAVQYLSDDFEVIHLKLRPDYLEKRRLAERVQSDRFVRSRETKIRNLLEDLARRQIPTRSYEHATLADTHNIIAHIRKNRV